MVLTQARAVGFEVAAPLSLLLVTDRSFVLPKPRQSGNLCSEWRAAVLGCLSAQQIAGADAGNEGSFPQHQFWRGTPQAFGGMNMEQVTQLIVEQRVRNRIMEYLLVVVEFESDPGVLNLNDLVNDWEFNISGPFDPRRFPTPTYTNQEIEALQAVDVAWNRLCDSTPGTIRDVKAAFALPEWAQFRTEARAALDVFVQRGKLSEDVEVA